MIVKRNTANDLTVILVDAVDFSIPETGVVFGAVTCEYAKALDSSLTSKTIDGSNWIELGRGLYKISFTAGELNTNGGFDFVVVVAGVRPYYGNVSIESSRPYASFD